MQVLAGSKVRYHRAKPQTKRERDKPSPPGLKIKMNKSQTCPDADAIKKVSPAKGCSEYLRRLGMHRHHFERHKPDHAKNCERKTEVCPRLPISAPNQQMNQHHH